VPQSPWRRAPVRALSRPKQDRSMLRLYTYFRSTAAYRVRIALALKGLSYESVPVHLVRNGGEQLAPAYRLVNPAALVPALQDDGAVITQSMAILEYLEDAHPEPPLLPSDALGRARVRALALTVACDVHPLGNLRVLNHLTQTFGADEAARSAWAQHWIALGFTAFEQHLQRDAATGAFCHGDTPTLADCCLVPQVFNARRFKLDLSLFPTIQRIAEHCETLPAFDAAQPARQDDSGQT
jgi:maleylpyruvate isomerase